MWELTDFDYPLPKELIAQYPLKKRDMARLLVLDRKRSKIEHRIFKDIVDYLHKDDLLILNDTKVSPCRLRGKRLSGGKVEILLLNQKSNLTFNALIKPSRLNIGERIILDGGKYFGVVGAKNEVTFSTPNIDTIYNLGMMPLPPYIKREPQKMDSVYYQTVYARKVGAIASPTAGLHFTKRLINRIQSKGINIAYITLHISYSTFKPVKTDDITKYNLDKEYFRIYDDTIILIKQAQAKKSRIFATGTTSCRTVETYAARRIKEGYTDLFIYPGYRFKMIDCLLTNFHLPRTTMFMLVCAFAGDKLIKKAYQEAIDKKYRFLSFGDAMLIL